MNSLIDTLKATVEIAVQDFQRGYVENFADYKYIGAERILVKNLNTNRNIKLRVFVYKVSVNLNLKGIPRGYWMRLTSPDMWKRVECPHLDSIQLPQRKRL